MSARKVPTQRANYFVKNSVGEQIEVGELSMKGSRLELLHECMSRFGHCLGSTKDKDGNTTHWTFSRCVKDGVACNIILTVVEFE